MPFPGSSIPQSPCSLGRPFFPLRARQPLPLPQDLSASRLSDEDHLTDPQAGRHVSPLTPPTPGRRRLLSCFSASGEASSHPVGVALGGLILFGWPRPAKRFVSTDWVDYGHPPPAPFPADRSAHLSGFNHFLNKSRIDQVDSEPKVQPNLG